MGNIIYIYVRHTGTFITKCSTAHFQPLHTGVKNMLKSNAANGQNLDTVQNSKLNIPYPLSFSLLFPFRTPFLFDYIYYECMWSLYITLRLKALLLMLVK